MTSKSAAIALLITALLAATTLLVLRKPGGGTPERASLLPAVGDSPTLRIETGGEAYEVAPGPLPGVWTLRTKAGIAWPVSPVRVRAALRLLSEAELEDARSAPRAPEDSPLSVTITPAAGGSSVTIAFGRLAAGGRAPVQVGVAGNWRAGFCDARIPELFEARSMAQWFEGAAIPYRDAPVQSIRLARDGTELELAAVGAAWSIRRPMVWPADAPACEQLRRSLAGAAARIVPGGEAPQEAGLTIELVSERREEREGEVRRTRIVQSIRLGPAADLSSRTAFATLEARAVAPDGATSVLWGPTVAVVSQEDFASVSLRPEAFASRVAWSGAAPEVRAVSIAPPSSEGAVKFALDLAGWKRDGAPTPNKEEGDAVAALLRLLCDERADAVTFSRAEAAPVATIRFGPAEAPEAQSVELLASAEGALIVRTSATDLYYAGSMTAQRLRAWLVALLAAD